MNGYPYDRLRHLQPSASFRSADLSRCMIATETLLPIASLGSGTAQSSVTALVHGDAVLGVPLNTGCGPAAPKETGPRSIHAD